MKYFKAILSFYNNCVEVPKRDFTNKFPRLSGIFYIIYFVIFILDLLVVYSFLNLFNQLIAEIFVWSCMPIFIVFLCKIGYEDLFDR